MQSYLPYVLILFLSCSCSSRIPEPVTYPYSQQKKMQASSHWEILATDLANRINNELIMTDNVHKTIYVKNTCGDDSTPCKANETSIFNEGLRDLLITKLVGYGVPIKSIPDENDIIVDYKVQIVHHNADRVRSIQPGVLTSLSAAVAVLYNAPAELIILAIGAGADIANSNMVSSSKYEIIITTSMTNDDRYLFRSSDIYYINDKDFFHYQETMPQTKTMMLSSGKSPNNMNSIELLPGETAQVQYIDDSAISYDKSEM